MSNAGETATEDALRASAKARFETSVADLLGISPESDTTWSYNSDQPLLSAVEALSKGVHRLLVIDVADHNRAYLLSQTDVVRYMSRHLSEISGWVDNDLASLGIGEFRKVVSVSTNETALTGFHRLLSNELTALAVVDEASGAVVDTLSAADVRGVDDENIGILRLPVSEFLKRSGAKHLDIAAITAHSSTALRPTLDQLTAGKVHRVWIVEGRGQPVGVVALSDVLHVLYRKMVESQ